MINRPLGMNKKPRLTIENVSASAKRLTAKKPSFGTMPTRESAKKDTAKSTAAVINQVFFYVTLDTKSGEKELFTINNKIRAYIKSTRMSNTAYFLIREY